MFEQDLKGEYLEISKIQEDEQEKILGRDNVVGVAVSHKIKKEQDTGDPCLTVFVEQKL